MIDEEARQIKEARHPADDANEMQGFEDKIGITQPVLHRMNPSEGKESGAEGIEGRMEDRNFLKKGPPQACRRGFVRVVRARL